MANDMHAGTVEAEAREDPAPPTPVVERHEDQENAPPKLNGIRNTLELEAVEQEAAKSAEEVHKIKPLIFDSNIF